MLKITDWTNPSEAERALNGPAGFNWTSFAIKPLYNSVYQIQGFNTIVYYAKFVNGYWMDACVNAQEAEANNTFSMCLNHDKGGGWYIGWRVDK
jgi:hypothetical protein